MNSKERNEWNRAFAASWRALQNHGGLVLSSALLVAARDLRDRGMRPGPVAAGLYWGTRDRQEAGRG